MKAALTKTNRKARAAKPAAAPRDERSGKLTFSGQSLARARVARHLSVEDLAEATGIDPFALRVFESYFGECVNSLSIGPSAEHVFRLAFVLQVRVAEFGVGHEADAARWRAWDKPKRGLKSWEIDGNKIRAARLRRGWDVEDLARRADVPVADVEALESEWIFVPMFVALRVVEELDERPVFEALEAFMVQP